MTEEMMSVDHGGGREGKMPIDYPANSRRAKEAIPERVRPEKIVEGQVTKRKKSAAKSALSAFVAEDGGSVMSYVLMEVLVPAAKEMISDTISQGIQHILYGGAGTYRGSGARRGYTNYSRITSNRRDPETRPPMSRQARANHDFDDVIIDSRAEAEDVLDRLRDLISEYDVATVSDLYDLVGLTGEFTDDKWGWYDLKSASIRAIRGGYLLNLPRTQPIT